MEKIPNAEEFFYKRPPGEAPEECLVRFATLHVEAAVKAILENATSSPKYVADEWGMNSTWTSYVNESSILNAYPLDNIK